MAVCDAAGAAPAARCSPSANGAKKARRTPLAALPAAFGETRRRPASRAFAARPLNSQSSSPVRRNGADPARLPRWLPPEQAPGDVAQGAFQFVGCRALVAQASSLRVGRVSNPPAPLRGVWRCRPVAIGWLPPVGRRPASPRSTLAGRLEVGRPAGWKPGLRGWPAPAGRPQVPCRKLRCALWRQRFGELVCQRGEGRT
jgi:hypothetical protein